jgi:hypothetical protein
VFGNQVLAFGSALVLDNKLLGVGLSALAELQRVDFGNISLRFEKVIFSNNHCVHLTRDADDNRATVRLWGRHLIVMGNHLKAGEGFFSMDFNGLNQVSLLGNVTTGGFLQLGGSVPTPAASFNLQI